jgi:uncharacterized protein DUF177 involved in 23S rRNA accumulation
MSPDVADPPLSRPMRITEIADNVPHTIEVTDAERAAMAALLELVALEGPVFEYRLRLGGGGRVHLSGRLRAQVAQTCVVTLEPVEQSVDLPIEAEFWPAELVQGLEQRPEDPVPDGLRDWPEAYTDNTFDLGPLIYETLATALDPYPKKEGASFQWSQGSSEAETQESGPFAALKQLKQR